MTTIAVTGMAPAEAARIAAPAEDAGLGALRTGRGNLPLDSLDVRAEITGLVVDLEVRQEFVNVHDEPLEATYVFPLPDRAAVTGMRMVAADRVIEAQLRERAAARAEYDAAIAAGRRASIAEEERPDVFTMRVGNILPGERVTVVLTLAGPLSHEDGEATFRFPLVVAPRYIPGTPLPGAGVGDGYAPDTDAVPDASRITPPILLPGFPHPVRLAIEVNIDPAGLPLGTVRSSLHTVDTGDGTIRVRPGERANRDFVLRLPYGAPTESAALTLVPDGGGGPADGAAAAGAAEGDGAGEGTYELTVLPPEGSAVPRPRDVVLLLDRSGSMAGWKMVAARRAASRIVDTLTDADRFAVLAFDSVVESPPTVPPGLAPAVDRHRFRAVEHLSRMDARGGTELLTPLRRALDLLVPEGGDEAEDPGRDRVLVLITDGQVGNEDQLLSETGQRLGQVRVHTVGIDQAVNAGFLGRLAAVGGGRCELVESEDRLDEAMARIHHRIGAPVLTDVRLDCDGLVLVDDTRTPDRLADVFPGVPYVVRGRYRGSVAGALTMSATTRDGRPWAARVGATGREGAALTAVWARAHLRDLEDRYVVRGAGSADAVRGANSADVVRGAGSADAVRGANSADAVRGANSADESAALERRMVEESLRFGVLCRFTAYVAVDTRVVTEGGTPHRILQPVEPAAGWDMLAGAMPAAGVPLVGAAPMAPMAMRLSSTELARSPAPGSAPTAFAASLGGGLRRPARVHGDALGGPGLLPSRRTTAGVDALRTQAAAEARRLRAAAAHPAVQRRELLEDLGTRLLALTVGAPPEAEPMRRLAEGLRPHAIAGRPLEEVWAYALGALEAFAGTAAPAGGDPDRHRSFWKR